MTAKTLAPGIAAIVDGGDRAFAWAIEIRRADSVAMRLCTGFAPVTLNGEVYSPVTGVSSSSIASTLGLQIDNQTISIGDSDAILREDILDGVWSGARYRIRQYDQLEPAAGSIPWTSGFIADIEPRIAAFDAEAHDLRQALLQDTTRTHQFGCPYELGDAKCRADLAPFTHTGLVVTAVASNQTFTTGLTEAADWATEGRLLFTLGENANGIWRKVKLHASGGVLTLDRATVYPVAVDDEFTVVAGCQHRPNEDCRDKFANKVNYGGCDTKPPVSDLMSGKLDDD
jgi:uncharacterized phage protein (TIGR02218 family)